MTPEEVATWKSNYQQNSYYYRGRMINTFNSIELAIELYLTAYFFGNPNDEHQFRSIILDRLTFEAKRTAFRSILDKKEDAKGFKKSKNNSYSHSKFIDDIRLMNDQRNYFAHYELVIPWEPDNSIITLVEDRDKIKMVSYDLEKYNNILLKMISLSNTIADMWRELLK